MLAKVVGNKDKTGAEKEYWKYVLPIMFLLASVLVQLKACMIAGIVNTGFQALLTLYYYRMTKKEFGGISGDTAGWYLCKSEMVSLFSLVIFLILKMV